MDPTPPPSDDPREASAVQLLGAGGRRRRRVEGGRPNQRTVRFDDAEMATLEAGAEQVGVDVATFIALAALAAAADLAHQAAPRQRSAAAKPGTETTSRPPVARSAGPAKQRHQPRRQPRRGRKKRR